MPHYSDGTEAKIGDIVRGKPYNTPHEVIGPVVAIRPGSESCNMDVAFAEVVVPEKVWQGDYKVMYDHVLKVHRFLAIRVDAGETRAFSRVHPPLPAAGQETLAL